jgi:2-polyprenyl-6-methoxyphenol hydroxylase-like FAD-dependent oxidoreductase
VALLGDAAHAILPSLGQGGCLALEDAVELSHALATAPDVPDALRRYDAARRPRTQWVAALSDRTARMTQARGRVATALRAVAIAVVPPRLAGAGLGRVVGWMPPDDPAGRSTT